jgi:chromosome segregation ATPase
MADKKVEPVAQDGPGDQESVSGQALTQAQLIDAVVKTGRHFQSVIDIGRELERVGNIRQSEKEATVSLNKALAALGDASLDYANAKEKLAIVSKDLAEKEAIRAKWDESVTAHQSELFALQEQIHALKLQGEEAQKRQESAEAAAQAMAKRILDSANTVKLQATKAKQEAKEEVAAQKEELAKGRTELAELQEKIAAAKTQIQNVFTGFGAGL